MNQLDRLERLAQRLIEKPFQRLFQTRLHPADLADHLTMVVAACRDGADSRLIPNHYQIIINPLDYPALVDGAGDRAIMADLVNHLTGLAAEGNCQFQGSLQVSLVQSESVPPGRVEVRTGHTGHNSGEAW
ncbi:MAG: DUF3662 domain-containing protein [Anaerolineae bacterium]|nr:DUF3662 domain-containing protein [Anaerolineae bacterium]